MYNLLNQKIITITPEVAENFLNCNQYEYQRTAKLHQVNILVKKIQNGTFLTGDIGLAKELFNSGKTVLVNGQHQSMAVIQTKKPIKALVSTYECSDPEDVALLYRQYDGHAARTLSELAYPQARAIGIQWPKRIISLVITAASIIENKTHLYKEDRIEMLHRYKLTGDFLCDILAPNNNMSKEFKHLYRSGVVAAMITTYRKSQHDTTIFWSHVRDGEDLKKTMPEYRLREFLTSVYVEKTGILPSSHNARKPAVTWHEVMARSIHAWNAFRRGEMTSLHYHADKPIPKAI